MLFFPRVISLMEDRTDASHSTPQWSTPKEESPATKPIGRGRGRRGRGVPRLPPTSHGLSPQSEPSLVSSLTLSSSQFNRSTDRPPSEQQFEDVAKLGSYPGVSPSSSHANVAPLVDGSALRSSFNNKAEELNDWENQGDGKSSSTKDEISYPPRDTYNKFQPIDNPLMEGNKSLFSSSPHDGRMSASRSSNSGQFGEAVSSPAADGPLKWGIKGRPECTLLFPNVPPELSSDELKEMIKTDCKRKEVKIEAEVRNGKATAVLDFEGVIGLWKRRHLKKCLSYKGQQLTWDIAEEAEIYDNRFLIENPPNYLTADQLRRRLKSCDSADAIQETSLKIEFFTTLEKTSCCVIFCSDPVVDKELVALLNDNADEILEDDSVSPVFETIQTPRTVCVSGLTSTTNAGDIRLTFHNHSALVQDIQLDPVSETSTLSYIVTFRRQSDVERDWSDLEPIEGAKPVVTVHHLYPTSVSGSDTPDKSSDVSLTTKNEMPSKQPVNEEGLPTKEVTEEKETEELRLNPKDDLDSDARVVNFIWDKKKRRRKLERAVGKGLSTAWDKDDEKFIIQPNSSKASPEKEWQEKCTDSLTDFLEKYSLKCLPVDSKLWVDVRQRWEDEEDEDNDDVVVIQQQKSTTFVVVGEKQSVKATVRTLKNLAKAAEKNLEEEESIVSKIVKANSMEQLKALQHSAGFAELSSKWGEVKFHFDQTRIAVEVECRKKLMDNVKEDVEGLITGFQTNSIEVPPYFCHYLEHRGFEGVNKKLAAASVDVKVIELDQKARKVKLAGSPSAFQRARDFLMNTYQSFPVKVEDVETGDFVGTDNFAQFAEKTMSSKDVVLMPLLRDIQSGEGRDACCVVGMGGDATAIANQFNEFLHQNVTYSMTLDLPSFAIGRYLQEHRMKELAQISKGLASSLATFEFNRADILVLRANHDGLQPLQRSIENVVRSVKTERKEFRKHGLNRFLESESYQKEKTHLEAKHHVIVSTGDDEEMMERLEEGAAPSARSTGSVLVAEFSSERHPGRTIKLFKGDLCDHQVDGIVNAANEELYHSGGLAKYILEKAGNEVQKESREYIRKNGKLPTGNAMRTKPGFLRKTKHIIHTVGPKWPKEIIGTVGLYEAQMKLKIAVNNTLSLASSLPCQSVALPAISSGIYGCPSDECARNMVESATEFFAKNDGSLSAVHFVMRPEDEANIAAFEKELRKQLKFLPPAPTHRKAPVHRLRVGMVGSDSGFLGDKPKMATSDETGATPSVSVVQGSTANQKVDVVVNSTNGDLSMECAMAAKALSRAAGPGLQESCSMYVARNGQIPEGGLAVTEGFQLPCRKVIHVCCPKKPKGLTALVLNFLKEASSFGATSIAIPALGTGQLAMSNKASAQSIFRGISEFYSDCPGTSLQTIRLVVFDKSRMSTFKSERKHSDLRPQPVVAPGGQAAVALAPATVNEAELQNGSRLAVEQGDIVSFNSEVIVVPVDASLDLRKGMVASKVSTAAGPALQAECKGQAPCGVGELVDLPGFNLQAKRVFALVCSRNDPADGIDVLKAAVVKCLLTAEAAGLSSIAIPALGTGNLRFSNHDAASAIFKAAIEFSQETSTSSLKTIHVVIFDGPRVDAFMKELHAYFPQLQAASSGGGFGSGVKRFFGRLVGAVGDVFGSSTKKEALESVEAAVLPDAVEVLIVGDNCHKAMDKLRDEIERECISEMVDTELPENLDQQKVRELQEFALKEHVILTFKPAVPGSGPQIFLSGWREDYHSALKQINKAITAHWKEDKETHAAEIAASSLKSRVNWYWMSDTGYREYSPQMTIQIEEALKKKQTFDVSFGQTNLHIDPVNREQISKGSNKVRRMKREDISNGVVLPVTWDEMDADKEVVQVELDKNSPEFKEVVMQFQATSGPGYVILRIQRIQNPRIYRFYAKEKGLLEATRGPAVSAQGFPVEWKLWHGTGEQVIQHIVAKGFNRSYSGGKVGSLLGQGVYFARDAKYSARNAYATPGRNGEQNMFLSRVLIGLFTVGTQGMVEPPPVNASKSLVDRFESTVNDQQNPAIFASCFTDHHAYPDYLVIFKKQ